MDLIAQESYSLKNRKVQTYFPDGKLSTLSIYRKGQLIRYFDYFPNGQLFQRIHFKNDKYHGKYWIWNEEEERVVKGIMKNGKPYRGEFETWPEEGSGSVFLKFKRREAIENKK